MLRQIRKGYRTYQRGKLLGRGAFSECYTFHENDSSNVFGAKIISKKELERTQIWAKTYQEIVVNMSIGDRSSHILKFDRYFEDQDNLYMLFQYCKHKTVDNLLNG